MRANQYAHPPPPPSPPTGMQTAQPCTRSSAVSQSECVRRNVTDFLLVRGSMATTRQQQQQHHYHHHQHQQDAVHLQLPALKNPLDFNDGRLLLTLYCFVKNFIGVTGCTSAVIDAKITEAMDLVKRALQEEVDALQGRIAVLLGRIEQLELENDVLKAHRAGRTPTTSSATAATAVTASPPPPTATENNNNVDYN